MDRPDDDLLEALQRGDDSAVEELLRRYQSRIYGYGMKMCRDPEDAREVLLDTMLTMTRSLKSFRGASSLSTCVCDSSKLLYQEAAEEQVCTC